jgi:hypothetical protein
MHTSVYLFSFVPLFNAQHISSEVHNVVVLVGIGFEVHMKDVQYVRFLRS